VAGAASGLRFEENQVTDIPSEAEAPADTKSPIGMGK
jgi:hypothetical protein